MGHPTHSDVRLTDHEESSTLMVLVPSPSKPRTANVYDTQSCTNLFVLPYRWESCLDFVTRQVPELLGARWHQLTTTSASYYRV